MQGQCIGPGSSGRVSNPCGTHVAFDQVKQSTSNMWSSTESNSHHVAMDQVKQSSPLSHSLLLALFCAFRRTLVALAGPPGAGKSTVAHEVIDRVNNPQRRQATPSEEPLTLAVAVPMDGFHLYRWQLDCMPVSASMGAYASNVSIAVYHSRHFGVFPFHDHPVEFVPSLPRMPMCPCHISDSTLQHSTAPYSHNNSIVQLTVPHLLTHPSSVRSCLAGSKRGSCKKRR